MEIKSRKIHIDYLRALGIILIILAHSTPPDLVFQLRNFDVPLMVMVSGASFYWVSQRKDINFSFLWKRILDILVPSTVLIVCIISFLLVSNQIDTNRLAKIVLLIGGYNYIWIFRVFLIVSVTSYLIYRYGKLALGRKKILPFLLLLIILAELINATSASDHILIEHYLLYALPYTSVFLLGYALEKYPELSRPTFLIFLSVFLLIASVNYLTTSEFIPTQVAKYPPTIYYLSYSVTISSFFIILFSNLLSSRTITYISSYLFFLSKYSVWVYIWHIPIVQILENQPYYINFFSTLFLSSIITLGQITLVKNLNNRINSKLLGQYFG